MMVLPYDKIIALLTLKQSMVLLLQLPDNPLCKRVYQAIVEYELWYKQYNFGIWALNIDEYSSQYPETACVHIPKIRVFSSGNLIKEIRGIPENTEFDNLIYNF